MTNERTPDEIVEHTARGWLQASTAASMLVHIDIALEEAGYRLAISRAEITRRPSADTIIGKSYRRTDDPDTLIRIDGCTNAGELNCTITSPTFTSRCVLIFTGDARACIDLGLWTEA